MKTILNISTIKEDPYYKYSYFSKTIDKFKIKKYPNLNINEINTIIKMVDIPLNLNKDSYKLNLRRAFAKRANKCDYFSLDGNRIYDLKLMNEFQLDMISYSIVESLRYILMNNNKSVKTSNILVDVNEKIILRSLLEELAKECRNIIMLTRNIKYSENIRKFIISNYGVSIELVYNETDMENIDFIITSKDKDYVCKNVWYINNFYKPKTEGTYISNVLYKVPWDIDVDIMSPQLIGLLVKGSKKRAISEILDSNDIRLESILHDGKETIV